MTLTDLRSAAAVPTTAWLRPGLALAALGWGANQFAPLIVLYQQRFGLSQAVVNAIFGLYALGLIPALLIGGRVSDRIGRRPVVLAALGLSALATVLLMIGSIETVWLAPGRTLSGVASGLAFGTGAAWLKELSAESGGASAGPRRATVTMTIGFGAGPLVAGVCAQWLPNPAVTAYVPHLFLLCVATVALLRAPDPARVATGPLDRADQDTAVLGQHLRTVLLPFAPWVFGTAALALAYLPALVARTHAEYGVLFGAVATALTALTGVLAQPLAQRINRPGRTRPLTVAMLPVLSGIACAAWAAVAATPLLVLLACALLGVAYGVTQFTGLVEVQRVAPAHRLGTATAAYQVLSYLGFALPYLLSLAQTQLHATPTTLLLAVLGLAAALTAWLTLTYRRAAATAARNARNADPRRPSLAPEDDSGAVCTS
ncbi:putative MFS family arabinose efflux permease [Nocardia tenerifensis]|uniref:Putative MFS family arabinose efflux permease n=1 Tax=Nocardia tenerifensis TaxID=228006 RepID=A0A318K4Q4_9NOCA|nr:MFS transporter [Nocardia tenerifensis]PXX63193.1 putative MFS family arabinose efflux permease [Nocardia tenerifensis]